MRVARTALACLPFLLSVACKGDTSASAEGGLSVVVISDLAVPKDISAVEVEIKLDGQAHARRVFELGPGATTLPLTVEEFDSSHAGKIVTATAIGLQGSVARVKQTRSAAVPRDEAGLLLIELEWLCTEGVRPASACATEETCSGGGCTTTRLDQDSLPERPASGVNSAFSARCLDVAACFKNSTSIVPMRDDKNRCVVERPNVNVGLNLGVKLAPNGDGLCTTEDCIVVINGFTMTSGWVESGDRLEIPGVFCDDLLDNPDRSLVWSGDCPTKTRSVPVCGDWIDTDPEPGVDAAVQTQNDAGGMQMQVDAGGMQPRLDSGVMQFDTLPMPKPAALQLSGLAAFADTVLAQTSTGMTATLKNTGEVQTSVVALNFNGGNGTDFSIDNNNCAGNLAGGAQCTFRVTFKPGALGNRSTTLRATAGSATTSFTLSGRGVCGTTECRCGSPAELAVDMLSARSCGDIPLATGYNRIDFDGPGGRNPTVVRCNQGWTQMAAFNSRPSATDFANFPDFGDSPAGPAIDLNLAATCTESISGWININAMPNFTAVRIRYLVDGNIYMTREMPRAQIDGYLNNAGQAYFWVVSPGVNSWATAAGSWVFIDNYNPLIEVYAAGRIRIYASNPPVDVNVSSGNSVAAVVEVR